MKVLITGHRKHKLESYDISWIQMALHIQAHELPRKYGYVRVYAGMASGVDIWFCHSCIDAKVPYVACIPFEGQEKTMGVDEVSTREYVIENAVEKRMVKNSWMVEECDMGVVVWDGNKGGTHNVLQQLVEKKKPFIWINPVSQVTYDCTELQSF